MRLLSLFLFIVAAFAADPVSSCTIFKMTQLGHTLIGNNEDWIDAKAKVWFLAAEPAKYGRVLFGFKNGWAQGGMNDQGLFFDGVAGEVRDWTPDSSREDFPGNLCEKALEECSTVKDAITIFERNNFPSLLVGTFVFVDATGKTAVIYFEKGRLRIEEHSAPLYALGYYGERADELLGDTSDLNVDTMARILGSCLRNDTYSTQYGNIYDPQNLIVHVYPSCGEEQTAILDLKEELARGDHYYELANVAEQQSSEILVDHKTHPVHDLPASSYVEYVGQYDSDNASITIIQSDKHLLLRSDIIFDAAMAIEILPVTADTFFARHLAIEVNFHRDSSGKIVDCSLAYDGEIYQGRKTRSRITIEQ